MINWYKAYDDETKGKSFTEIDYSKYSPYTENSIFTLRYFDEIKRNFFKFEQGCLDLNLNNDHFCTKCQVQLLKQSTTLCGIFKTDSLLSEEKSFQDLAKKAVKFFEAERFYYFSFWNAVVNDKQFLLDRLRFSFLRFYKFLIELNKCFTESNSTSASEGNSDYKELQTFLIKSYKVLIMDIEHFEYLYQNFVKLIKSILDICNKLTQNIQFIINNYDSATDSGVKIAANPVEIGEIDMMSILKSLPQLQQGTEPNEKDKSQESNEKSENSQASDEKEEKSDTEFEKVCDMGIVKKNLRRVFHEKKLQRYQKQKQKLDQQLLNRERRQVNSLKDYFKSNFEMADDNLYYYNELLSKHHLNNIEDKNKTAPLDSIEKHGNTYETLGFDSPKAQEKQKSFLESREFKESPNNPNYRYEKIMAMAEEKKRKEMDEYINGISFDFLQTRNHSWLDSLAIPDVEKRDPRKITSSATLIKGLSNIPEENGDNRNKEATTKEKKKYNDEAEKPLYRETNIGKASAVSDKRPSQAQQKEGSEASDESVFTEEECKDETAVGTLLSKKVELGDLVKSKIGEEEKTRKENIVEETKQILHKDEEEKKKGEGKDSSSTSSADWIGKFSFKELIRQKKFEVIPKKTGVRASKDKRPAKYREVMPKSAQTHEHNTDFCI